MRLSMTLLSTVLMLACGTVQAQAYRWVDKDGKVRYGDIAPPGVKATPLKAPPGGTPTPSAAPGKAGASKDGVDKSAKKGPVTPAEQEQAYRERQAKLKEEQGNAAKEREVSEQKKLNCAAAQESLRLLQSGRRVSNLTAQGEIVYLDEAQTAERIAQTEKAVNEACK